MRLRGLSPCVLGRARYFPDDDGKGPTKIISDKPRLSTIFSSVHASTFSRSSTAPNTIRTILRRQLLSSLSLLILRLSRKSVFISVLAAPTALYLAAYHQSQHLRPSAATTTSISTDMPKKKLLSKRHPASSSITPSQHAPPASTPQTFLDGLPLPKLLVFDLDYTLWPFWVDTHVSGPVKPASPKTLSRNTAMLDRYGESFAFYTEVPGILHAARQRGVAMGLASRTHAPDLAEKMLRGIIIPVPDPPPSVMLDDAVNSDVGGADEDTDTNTNAEASKQEPQTPSERPSPAWSFFKYREIYPGSKVTHFTRIQGKTAREDKSGGVAFADMVFFDDEGRNRDVEAQLGVTFVLVRDGVTRDEVDRGVREWRRRRGLTGKKDGDGPADEEEMSE